MVAGAKWGGRAEASMSWICSCGSSNGDEQPFCRKCGYYLTEKPQQSACAPPQQATAAPPNIYIQQTTVVAPQQRRGGCCGIIAAAFLLLLVIGAIESACPSRKREQPKPAATLSPPSAQAPAATLHPEAGMPAREDSGRVSRSAPNDAPANRRVYVPRSSGVEDEPETRPPLDSHAQQQ